MAWHLLWRTSCDVCGNGDTFRGPMDKAWELAASMGWHQCECEKQIRHLCPVCAKGERPEWWPETEGVTR